MIPRPCRYPGCTDEATRWSRRGYCESHGARPSRKAPPQLIRPHEISRPKEPPLVFNNYGYLVVKRAPGGLKV
jgi:hypothetical protein